MQDAIAYALETAADVYIVGDRRMARLRAQVYALLRELPEEMTVRELLSEFEPDVRPSVS